MMMYVPFSESFDASHGRSEGENEIEKAIVLGSEPIWPPPMIGDGFEVQTKNQIPYKNAE